MVDNMDKIRELEERYKYNWGYDVDYTLVIPGLTQEKLITILESIVNTGESLIVGYNKCFLK